MGYTYQAPKDFDKQSARFRKTYADEAELLTTGKYSLQLKYDGVFAALFTGNKQYSRQGEEQVCSPHLLEEATKRYGTGKLVTLELWMPNEMHKAINGAARRESAQPNLQGRIFDMISVDEFNAGKCEVPYADRRAEILDGLDDSGSLQFAETLDYDTNGSNREMLLEAAARFQSMKVPAYDGLILRDNTAIWLPGASKNGEVIKIKPADTYDLRIVGQFAEQRETKLGGYIVVEYKGEQTNVGSGLTQEQLAAIMDGSLNLVGQSGEIAALGVTPAGKLREPRLKGIRHDAVREEDKLD